MVVAVTAFFYKNVHEAYRAKPKKNSENSLFFSLQENRWVCVFVCDVSRAKLMVASAKIFNGGSGASGREFITKLTIVFTKYDARCDEHSLLFGFFCFD